MPAAPPPRPTHGLPERCRSHKDELTRTRRPHPSPRSPSGHCGRRALCGPGQTQRDLVPASSRHTERSPWAPRARPHPTSSCPGTTGLSVSPSVCLFQKVAELGSQGGRLSRAGFLPCHASGSLPGFPRLESASLLALNPVPRRDGPPCVCPSPAEGRLGPFQVLAVRGAAAVSTGGGFVWKRAFHSFRETPRCVVSAACGLGCLVWQTRPSKLPFQAPGHVAFPPATRESARCPASRPAWGAVGGAGLGSSEGRAGALHWSSCGGWFSGCPSPLVPLLRCMAQYVQALLLPFGFRAGLPRIWLAVGGP